MSIEIKQLLIKTNIVQRGEREDVDLLEYQDVLKEEVLAECRRLIHEVLSENGER